MSERKKERIFWGWGGGQTERAAKKENMQTLETEREINVEI